MMSLKENSIMFLETFSIMQRTISGKQFSVVESKDNEIDVVKLINHNNDKTLTTLKIAFINEKVIEIEIDEHEIGSNTFQMMLDDLNNAQITYVLEQPQMVGGYYTGTSILKAKTDDYENFMTFLNSIQDNF